MSLGTARHRVASLQYEARFQWQCIMGGIAFEAFLLPTATVLVWTFVHAQRPGPTTSLMASVVIPFIALLSGLFLFSLSLVIGESLVREVRYLRRLNAEISDLVRRYGEEVLEKEEKERS